MKYDSRDFLYLFYKPFSIVLLLFGLFGMVWLRSSVVDISYEIRRLENEKSTLIKERQLLTKELTELLSIPGLRESVEKHRKGSIDKIAYKVTIKDIQPNIVQYSIKKLPSGIIIFNLPSKMRVNQKKRIEVRISRDFSAAMRDALKLSDSPQTEQISVNTFMKVRLLGSNFRIDAFSNDNQIILDNEVTEWAWDVTPLKSGTQIMTLAVSVRLQIPNHGEENKDSRVIDKNVIVDFDPFYSLKVLTMNNIPVILNSGFVVWAFIGFMINECRKRKKEKAMDITSMSE